MYGFKLNSLDSLTMTKASDKRSTILNYIADLVHSDYPELRNFYAELKCIDKGALFSLENIMTDVHELEKGMSLTRFVFLLFNLGIIQKYHICRF